MTSATASPPRLWGRLPSLPVKGHPCPFFPPSPPHIRRWNGRQGCRPNCQAGKPAPRTHADASYWIYQYDTLGQVISGKHFWPAGTPVAGQQFEYGFDDIGNRQSAAHGGNAGNNPNGMVCV